MPNIQFECPKSADKIELVTVMQENIMAQLRATSSERSESYELGNSLRHNWY